MVLAHTIFPSHTHLHPNQIYGWYGLIIYNWVVSSLKPAQGCSPMHWSLPQAPQLTDARRGQVWSACPWPGTQKSSALECTGSYLSRCQDPPSLFLLQTPWFSPQSFSPRKLAARFAHIPGRILEKALQNHRRCGTGWGWKDLVQGPTALCCLKEHRQPLAGPSHRLAAFGFRNRHWNPKKCPTSDWNLWKAQIKRTLSLSYDMLWYMSGMDMDVSFLRLDNHTN